MVHAGVYGESVSYTARSDSKFRFADDPARTSSKPAASLRNYELGKPTPRRRCAGNAPIAVPTYRSFRDEERGRRVPNQCSHGGQVVLVFGVDQLLVHSLDFLLVARLGDQSPRWRKSKNDHHPEELQRWYFFILGLLDIATSRPIREWASQGRGPSRSADAPHKAFRSIRHG